jgi:wyosine [tRNA(Phe)-imidazoG37] synthetase (radical SAM superfamily)
LGRTTNKTIKLKEYFSVNEILGDLKQRLQEIQPPDYITLSGSGEPTLHSCIGEIISGIKELSDIPVAVLTNGSLFWLNKVCESVLEADLIIPSLDAGDENIFQHVNRPHKAISFKKMLDGLCSLRKSYSGRIWLEVFLVDGVTTIESEVLKIKTCIDLIAPERVQLNTAVRTPAKSIVNPATKGKMEEIAGIFGSNCEVVADFSGVHDLDEYTSSREDVLELLRRRPCSVDDISNGLNIHRNETVKYVQELSDRNLIRLEKRDNKLMYFAV